MKTNVIISDTRPQEAKRPIEWGWCYFRKLWTTNNGSKFYWAMFRRLDPPKPGEQVIWSIRFQARKPTAALRHIVAEVNAGRETLTNFVDKEIN